MHRRRYKTSAGKVDFLLGDEKVVIEVKLNRKGRKVEKRYGNYATLYMDYIAEEKDETFMNCMKILARVKEGVLEAGKEKVEVRGALKELVEEYLEKYDYFRTVYMKSYERGENLKAKVAVALSCFAGFLNLISLSTYTPTSVLQAIAIPAILASVAYKVGKRMERRERERLIDYVFDTERRRRVLF
mgnify:CR=1 FL=1